MDNLIRIGNRLFNLLHVTSIEPVEGQGEPTVDVHIVQGRSVRLAGDDARAASFFVECHPSLPVDREARDRAEATDSAAQDQYIRRFQQQQPDRATDPRS